MAREKIKKTRKHSAADLAAIVHRQIATGQLKPGDRLMTMRDLAQRYGLSIGSARRAMLQLEQEGRIVRRWGSGCYVTQAHLTPPPDHADRPHLSPVSTATRAASRNLVILLPYDGHFYDRLTSHLCEQAMVLGLTPVKLQLPLRPETSENSGLFGIIEQWKNHPPAAVVTCDLPLQIGRLIEDACGTRTHLVGVMMSDGPSRPHLWHRVMAHTANMGEALAESLFEAGHRRIGLITNQRRVDSQILPRSVRKQAYGHTELILALGRGLRRRGGPGLFSVYYNQELPQSGPCPFSPDEMQRIVTFMQRQPRITALIGLDFRLMAAMQAWRAADLPESQLPVMMGIGNTPWSQTWGFDSYCYQPQAIAQAVLSVLNGPIAPAGPVQKIRIDLRLIRHSNINPLASAGKAMIPGGVGSGGD